MGGVYSLEINLVCLTLPLSVSPSRALARARSPEKRPPEAICFH